MQRAFDRDAEGGLVESLRRLASPIISLVAEVDGEVGGHVMFTPVTIEGEGGPSRAMGLGPLAVEPKFQRQGVGAALVSAGLDACRRLGEWVVFVLGHRTYYPRFGFRPAAAGGLHFHDTGPEPAFMVLELRPGALAGRSGWVRFLPPFDEV